ncbi:MAG: hypothetical protein H6R10_1068 [Rhodocyclaceae bacterium]|nr:hypothetical protein [Rhodocyclaceae bacterium]
MKQPKSQTAQTQTPPVWRGKGAALESPQGEQAAQLETAIATSPQRLRQAQFTAMADTSPRTTAQRKLAEGIHNSPYITAQRKQLEKLSGGTVQLQAWSRQALDGRQTDVTWATGSLGGDVVGLHMEASPLGPEHLQGSPPQSGEQATLMGKLPTATTNSNENKYIRGHLLNDNVGGPGVAANLFPITANANSQHHSLIESKVKNWVNVDKQWVHYKVEVQNIDHNLNKGGKNKYVDADLKCEASILDPTNGMGKKNTISATIKSELGSAHDNDAKKTQDSGFRAPKGLQAAVYLPLLSSGSNTKVYGFAEKLFSVMKQLVDYGEMYTVSELLQRMDHIQGFGPKLKTLFETELSKLLSGDTGEISGVLSTQDKSGISRINKMAEQIIEEIGMIVEEDYDDETRASLIGD